MFHQQLREKLGQIYDINIFPQDSIEIHWSYLKFADEFNMFFVKETWLQKIKFQVGKTYNSLLYIFSGLI